MQEITINNAKCKIIQRLHANGFWASDDFKSRVKFFEAAKEPFGHAILSNYGKYWGVGENYYDATESLYAQMFMANRDKFIKIIDSEQKQTRK